MPPRLENLRESSHRVVRLVALGHLADAAAARDRLALGTDDEALHDFRVALRRFRSWERAFRDYTRHELRKKLRRKVRDLARDTGASRDLEVHLGWLAAQRGSLTRRQRPGLNWLLSTLDGQKADADAVLERDVDRRFTRLRSRLEAALSTYRETVALRNGGIARPVEPFAAALAPRIAEQAAEMRDHIGHVHSLADATEAHEARITAKRTRYLVEPIAKLVPGASAVVDRLKSLQDVLGDLHDAQVFGRQVERLAVSLEREASSSTKSDNGTDPHTPRDPAAVKTAPERSSALDSATAHAARNPGSVVESVAEVAPMASAMAAVAPVSTPEPTIASGETATAASEGKARPAPDLRIGVAAIRQRLRERADAAFAQFVAEWSGSASAEFFHDVDAVVAAIGGAARATVEIERKYLLRALPDEARDGLRLDIDQGYVPGTNLHERIRRVTVRHRAGPSDVRFYRTVKFGEGLTRTELEEQTTEAIFEAMWPLTKGRRVRKRRYAVTVDGKTWELDEFRNRDLVLAEIELDSEDEEITFPSWLALVVEREVTGEAEYLNINLAK